MAPTDVDHKKFLLFPSIFPSHSVDISFWLHRRSSSSSKRKMRRKQPKKGGNSLKRKLKSSRCKTIYWNFSTSQLSTNVWATQDYSRLRANYFCGVHSIRNKSLTFTTLLWQLNHYILKIDYSKVFSFRTGTQFFGNVQNFLYFLLFCCFQF